MIRARTLASFLIVSFLQNFSILPPSTSAVISNSSNGFSFELIYRDSPESPLYSSRDENLTQQQRMKRFVHYSKAHLQQYYVVPATPDPATVRPPMTEQGIIFIVKLGIGTFPSTTSYKSFYLVMDTGSDLIWTQCETCLPNRCFLQRDPPFPNTQSRSYRPLPCNRHPLCFKGQCNRSFCSYKRVYGDNSSSEGILAAETFTFDSDRGADSAVPGLVFGCGSDNKDFKFGTTRENQIAGILGMGWGRHSFVQQIKSQSDGRFSYCLVAKLGTSPNPPRMFLRFGDDVPRRPNLRWTPVFARGGPNSPYYLYLQGVTMVGSGSGSPPKRIAHIGECVIDSGAAISHIRRATYAALRVEMARFFLAHNFTKIGSQVGLDLCYKTPSNARAEQFPSIKLNFRGADLELSLHGTYYFGETESGQDFFCLAMLPADIGEGRLSLIGAFQQIDHRFIFDTNQYKLYFTPEDCATTGA
ncbi:Aspartic peptidase [Trema orientale]|uniref:Aspartic peptidase n=1 Tax=Trema orientale TaxID=63057 RepID=A0A2P5ERJ9_TREOI|nr:Aspartic peptidase [Trema orientale]